MRAMLMAFIATVLSGCASAGLVQSNYEPNKGGVVKYKNSAFGGAPSAEKAQQIMTDFCSPERYSVIQQRASSETVAYNANTTGSVSPYGNYSQNTNVTPVNRNYVYVQFRCGGLKASSVSDFFGFTKTANRK